MGVADKYGKKTFEEAINRLEDIVKELEEGRLGLAPALELFAEGIELSRFCSVCLEDAEQRISILTGNDQGRIIIKEVISELFPGEGA